MAAIITVSRPWKRGMKGGGRASHLNLKYVSYFRVIAM
tara:strand:+ start:1400 stop:1513 length:114 start_codon:yes stop_codon:yes gene_type:complete